MKDKQTEPVKLTTINTQFESDMLLAILEDNGIPAYRQHQGSGGYMAIYMGYSVFGSDIYVNAADYEKAKELLDLLESEEGSEGFGDSSLPTQDEVEDNQWDNDGDEDSDSGEPLSKKDDPRYRFCIFFIRILLVFILGSIAISAVAALYQLFSLL